MVRRNLHQRRFPRDVAIRLGQKAAGLLGGCPDQAEDSALRYREVAAAHRTTIWTFLCARA